MNAEPGPLWLYAPLWGVDFDSDAAALVGGSTLASIPYPDEWQTLQRTAVADERRRIAGVTIPPCLTIPIRRVPDQNMADAMSEHRPRMLQELRRSVLALRLHQPGWFLDPELAEICFAVVDQGWSITRQPGPYRQSFLSPDSPSPFPGYSLEICDLSQTREEAGAITARWNLLAELDHINGNAPLLIALENFNRSYGYQSTAADRLAHLFMALDAVLGSQSGDAPGEIELRGPGARLYRRLKAALLMDGMNPVNSGREAAWACSNDRGEGRWLRNRVAHGDPIDDSEGVAQLRLQTIVRAVLRGALDFFCHWPQTSTARITALNIDFDTPPIGVFNLVLAQSSHEAKARE